MSVVSARQCNLSRRALAITSSRVLSAIVLASILDQPRSQLGCLQIVIKDEKLVSKGFVNP